MGWGIVLILSCIVVTKGQKITQNVMESLYQSIWCRDEISLFFLSFSSRAIF